MGKHRCSDGISISVDGVLAQPRPDRIHTVEQVGRQIFGPGFFLNNEDAWQRLADYADDLHNNAPVRRLVRGHARECEKQEVPPYLIVAAQHSPYGMAVHARPSDD
ncbi:MAG TPA: hypothetical protein VJH97_00860 [Candidatus Nanoarchaeia archaeon]|nr:hypothetical protein [Candidatus Nanoarchaeia archaeon]